MENIKSRSSTRKVAIVDVVISIAGILFLIYGLVNLSTELDEFNKMKESLPGFEESEEGSRIHKLITITWIHDPVCGILLGINIWAAIMVYQHTNPDSELVVALQKAIIWRNINLSFIIIKVAFAAYMFTLDVSVGILAISPVFFRAVFVVWAWKFIKELQKATVGYDTMDEDHLTQFPEV